MKQVRSNMAEETQNLNPVHENTQNENGLAFILVIFVISALGFLLYTNHTI